MDINYGNQPQESDHAKPSEYLMAELGTSYQGLSQNDASRRLERYGKNLIPRAYRRNAATIALAQFQSPLIYILIVASIIAFVLGDRIEASLIVGIVVVNAALGFIQEYRSEQTLEDLRKYITYRAKVRRDGQEQEIDTTELVPGDIIHLNIGDIVPADAKLIDAEDASVNEAALTGESLPVPKVTVDVAATKPQAERIDTVFMGTIITDGAGTGVVVNTGADTQFGRVALSLREKAPPSEFQIGISQFGRLLLVIILAMTAFIFATNAFFGRGILTSLLFALALAVGITPEALPAIITVTLSRGALYLARSQVITKKLSSIEDLGNMDILCTDKTGTLTKGIVSLENTFGINKEERPDLVVYGVLCNSAVIRRGRLTGNPIDIAVLDYARKNRISTAPWHVIDYNEFDFERRRMSVVARNGKTMLICKGAPESVIEVSSHADIAGEIRPIDQVRDNIEKTYKDMASQGLRLIGIAMKEIEEKPSYTKADELDLTFVGFISFIDAPKRGVRGTLTDTARLGVELKVLTGDEPLVTANISHRVGIDIKGGRIILGPELDGLEPREMEEIVSGHNIFCRVNPEQKLKVVTALHNIGHVVGFLGDGINDAPALRTADVGISVDTAVDVAKDAADIILLKKSLRVINNGIIEGRRIFGNITKYILNTVSANFGNMITVAGASLLLPFIPLLPAQILLNNILSDIPLVTISTDNVDPELTRRPRRWDIHLISRFMLTFGLLSTMFDFVTIGLLAYILMARVSLFRTGWFLESLISEIVVTFAIRTTKPFFKSRPSEALILSSLIIGLFSFAILYIPLGRIFNFIPLPGWLTIAIIAIVAAYFGMAEIYKRRFFKSYGL